MTSLFTVFGSDGFVGKRLVQKLMSDGHVVQTVGRGDDFKAKWRDLGHVLYCVGITGSRYKTEQFRVVDAHISAMADVLEHGSYTSFLYMSSARTYEETLAGTDERAQFKVDPSNISDFYNLSKLMGESLILNAGIHSARIVRVSYAVDITEDSTDNITQFIRDARHGSVRFVAHRDSVKDYIVMNDVLTIVPKIATDGKSILYNLASGVNTSTSDIAALLASETGCVVDFADEEPVRSPRPIDISLLVSEMSFSPQLLLDYARQVIRSGKPS